MRKTLVVMAAAGLVALGSPHGRAAQCSVDPFADVLASNANCSSVEWLKNRQVTLGCGGAFYCPDSSVTRFQMALFMQRLADKLVEQPVGSGPPAASLVVGPLTLGATVTASNTPCTTFVPIAGHPRTAIASVNVSLQMGAGGAGDVGVQIVHTTDGNTTNYQGSPGHINQVATATQGAWSHVSDAVVVQIPAGQGTKFGAALFTFGGNTALAVARCNLMVEIQSRTGSGTPFDESF